MLVNTNKARRGGLGIMIFHLGLLFLYLDGSEGAGGSSSTTSSGSPSSGSNKGPPKILGRDFKPLQVVRVGQEFRVACPIQGEPSPNIDWFKDGEPITSAWSRFRVNSKALKIRSALAKDSGIYECKGVNGFGSIIARTRLLVTDESSESDHVDMDIMPGESFGIPPAFTIETLKQSGPLHIPSGNSIRFRCDTKGMAKVMWYKDGKAVSDKMFRYGSWGITLHKLTHEDSGSYTCKASNSLGRNEFNIQLEITELIERKRPSFVAGYPNNATVFAGNEVTLECLVRGGTSVMPPHIKWLKRIPHHETVKHKHLIPVENENQHVLVIQDSEEEGIRVNETQINGTYISTLTFRKPDARNHAGVYVCLATNSVGYTYRDAHLTIVAGPQIVENSSSGIPFPLIVFLLSTALSVLVTGSACCLRNYQKAQQKQSQTLTARKFSVSTPSVSMSSSMSSSYQQKSCPMAARKQLLVVPTLHPDVFCQSHVMTEPTIEIALSRCSYCGEDSSEISGMKPYEHCYNASSSYLGSPSHALRYSPWS